MNLATFFDHWKIAENPFKGEEARQDHVFWRLEGISGPDAVPAIVDRTDLLDPVVAEELRTAVCAEREAWDLDAGGLASNASRIRADRLLEPYCADVALARTGT